ncbi:MAG: efflux RND transporter periplasmic adaptor subunit [Nitrospirae bacterium]|nr:efflux RND transporter periplasmic adaptor subunit [Nitrospirota bacterium]
MANPEDLIRLTVDKPAAKAGRTGRSPLLPAGIVLGLIIAAIIGFRLLVAPTVRVESATVSMVYPSQSFTLLNASGYVVAQRKAAVASKVTGRLVAIYVEEGNRIKKGDIIALLENDDVLAAKERAAANLRVAAANLDQAEAELADAASNLDRSRELLRKGFISKLEYDTSEARHKKAAAAVASAEASITSQAAALREAEVSIEYTRVRAPFDGVVLTKNADIGDIVTPLGAAANAKAAVVTIADMQSLQAEVDVSESNIGQVTLKQPCEIQLDGLPESRFRGEVHMIVPTADRTKATVMVKVRFLDNDPRILPEMSAKVAFLQKTMADHERKPRTAVASESLVSGNGKTSVFLIKDNRALETPVVAGEKIGDMVEIISGVKAGERIVRKATDKIRNNIKVTVSEK